MTTSSSFSSSLSGDVPTTAELDRAGQQMAQRMAAIGQADAKLHASTITETGANGAIRVTVSTSGALRKAELVGGGARLSAGEAIAELTACIQRAQAKIAQRAAEVLAGELGNDPAIERVITSYQERYPTPPEPAPAWNQSQTPPPAGYADRPPVPPAPPRPAPQPMQRTTQAAPRRNTNDDDWGSQSFMRPV